MFKKLSPWQNTALATALLERMLPNYQMFSQAADFGDYKTLRNQVDLVWQKLADRSIKINSDAQVIKLEDNIPEPDEFDFFGVYPALDACMALTALLQGGQESGFEHTQQVSRLSANSVSYYVELLLAEEFAQQDEITLSEKDIDQHPLMEWENATQQELYDFLQGKKENKQTCQQLKTLALAEGISNLGIEIS